MYNIHYTLYNVQYIIHCTTYSTLYIVLCKLCSVIYTVYTTACVIRYGLCSIDCKVYIIPDELYKHWDDRCNRILHCTKLETTFRFPH